MVPNQKNENDTLQELDEGRGPHCNKGVKDVLNGVRCQFTDLQDGGIVALPGGAERQ